MTERKRFLPTLLSYLTRDKNVLKHSKTCNITMLYKILLVSCCWKKTTHAVVNTVLIIQSQLINVFHTVLQECNHSGEQCELEVGFAVETTRRPVNTPTMENHFESFLKVDIIRVPITWWRSGKVDLSVKLPHPATNSCSVKDL